MLPVLFSIVIPDGWAKPVAVGLWIAIVLGRAIAWMRKSSKDGQPIGLFEALRDDVYVIVVLAGVVGALWRTGLLDGPVRLPLHTYGLLIATGFLVGIWLAQREARRRGQDA